VRVCVISGTKHGGGLPHGPPRRNACEMTDDSKKDGNSWPIFSRALAVVCRVIDVQAASPAITRSFGEGFEPHPPPSTGMSLVTETPFVPAEMEVLNSIPSALLSALRVPNHCG
jgi:hypothetical protein